MAKTRTLTQPQGPLELGLNRTFLALRQPVNHQPEIDLQDHHQLFMAEVGDPQRRKRLQG